ncbi:hypothetical protein HCJ46_17080 [Listeria booriae]|uniref:hypothetical protein n=1 Tax=Listeria booriae TaxID=1552123 RepID=UPI001625A1C1|nr:hypothetical protein [Listeria booriae]MBC1920467.1 hypothetical protein [Listeria booriae]
MFKKKEAHDYTQDLADLSEIYPNSMLIDNALIAGLKCSTINTTMMKPSQRNDLRINFGIALAGAGLHQIKIEAEPVDLSEKIEEEYRILESTENIHKSDLRRSYIDYLEKSSEDNSTLEKQRYLLLREEIRNDKEINEKMDILLERVREVQEDFRHLTEDGYDTQLLSGQQLVQLLQIDLNNNQAKLNRFVSKSPDFILYDEQEDIYAES